MSELAILIGLSTKIVTFQFCGTEGAVYNLIKYRAKLLNADWSMKRVFFLRLVLRLPSNSLCYREVVFL